MIRIAELIDPAEPSPPWPLLKQVGVDHVVSLLEAGEQQDAVPARSVAGRDARDRRGPRVRSRAGACPRSTRLKQRYEEAGLRLAAIEDNPPMDKLRLGLPGRDEQIEAFCELLRNDGRLGIPVLVLQLDAGLRLGCARAVDVPARGGALVSGYDHARDAAAAPPTRGGDRPSRGAAVGEPARRSCERVVPGRRGGGRHARAASRRPAALADARHRPDHAQRRGVPAADRPVPEPGERRSRSARATSR